MATDPLTDEKQKALSKTFEYVTECCNTPNAELDSDIIETVKAKVTRTNLAEWCSAELKYNNTNSEDNAINKALQLKLKSVYQRELRKLVNKKDLVQESYVQTYTIKEKTKPANKLERQCVIFVDFDRNKDWKKGITRKCLDLCRIGLGNFGTFSSYFYFFATSDLDMDTPYVAKMKTEKTTGQKTIVFTQI